MAATLIGLAVALGPAPAVIGSDKQWTGYGALPGDAPVFGLANSPSQPETVYAATVGASLVQTDDGTAWHEVSASLPRRLWRVAIDAAPDTAGFPPMYVGSNGEGFWKSLDGGKTWTQADNGLSGAGALNVRAIALGIHLIVVGTSNGVFKTADGGGTWQAMGLQGFDISAVAFAQFGLGGSPPVVIAGIDGEKNPGARLLSSTSLSSTWAPLHQGVPADLVVSAVAAGPVPSGANARPVWVAGSSGVLKSDDGGGTWAVLAGLPNPQGFGAIAASSADPNVVYVASDGSVGAAGGGVWRSSDRGGSWQQLATGLTEHAVTAISLGRDQPGTLIAATYTPDTPSVLAFQYRDAQVTPSGTPEDGVCPETSCGRGTASAPAAVHGSPLSAAPLVNPCPSPSPSPSPSPNPSASGSAAASPTPAPSGSGSPKPSPSPTPCTSRNPTPRQPEGSDLPLWLAVAGVGVLI